MPFRNPLDSTVEGQFLASLEIFVDLVIYFQVFWCSFRAGAQLLYLLSLPTSTNTNSFCSPLLHINTDIQPNFRRMSEAVAIASQEIARVPNVPSFDNGQRILEAIGALAGTVESLRSDVTSLRTDITNLRTDMNGRFELLELRMNAESDYFLLCSKLYYTNIVLIVRSTRPPDSTIPILQAERLHFMHCAISVIWL